MENTKQHSSETYPSSKKRGSGQWGKTEHDRFLKGLQKYGRNWINVQRVVKTRTLSQVRSHAQKFFLNMSEDDIQALIMGDDGSQAQDFNYNHETVNKMSKSKKEKKYETRIRKVQEFQNKQQIKRKMSQSEKNLLDIFVSAIQNELKQINSEKQVKQIQTSNMIEGAKSQILTIAHIDNHENQDNQSQFQKNCIDQILCRNQKLLQINPFTYTNLFGYHQHNCKLMFLPLGALVD